MFLKYFTTRIWIGWRKYISDRRYYMRSYSLRKYILYSARAKKRWCAIGFRNL